MTNEKLEKIAKEDYLLFLFIHCKERRLEKCPIRTSTSQSPGAAEGSQPLQVQPTKAATNCFRSTIRNN